MTFETKDALSLTDDENDDFDDGEIHLPELAGTLSKWTNYIHGWQDRYIVLKDRTLSYYKSENETAIGCRGAVSLAKAVIQSSEFDDCRFDVAVNDSLWYLRTSSAEDCQRWVEQLELHKAESGYSSEKSLHRHGSMLSLTSTASLSTTSASSFKRGRGLREKLAEMETFRDILCRQVDTLQSYFDACMSTVLQQTAHDLETDDIDDVEDVELLAKKDGAASGAPVDTHRGHSHVDMLGIFRQHGAHAVDFKGESCTFKATTAGILATLSHCIELMSQREEAWQKRLDREVDKRRKLQDAYRNLVMSRQKPVVLGGPDFEEGPHSMMNEDEFFDAVDATLDKLDREEEKLNQRLSVSPVAEKPAARSAVCTSLSPTHPLFAEINRVVADHISHADMTASDVAGSWELIAEDGDMKVYKRELEENGMCVDPIKAVHTVKGITGHELCQYFWDPAVRLEWETTLDSTQTLEWYSVDTVVTLQVHRRVWPATQRDSLFWSTIRHCPSEDDEGPDYWIVANHSTEHPAAPLNNKYVRIHFNVAMVCQTVVQPPTSGAQITRDHLTCRIAYTANVNPGGWAPASAVRIISKKKKVPTATLR